MNLRFGPTVADASGSVGGLTLQRSRSGPTGRVRSKPTHRGTALQQARQAAMSTWTALWSTALTQNQREAWNLWASMSPTTNRLGQAIHQAGHNAFFATNALLALAARVLTLEPPFLHGRAAPVTSTCTAYADDVIAHLLPDEAQYPRLPGHAVIIFQGRPQPPGRKAPPPNWRFLVAHLTIEEGNPEWQTAQASKWPLTLGHTAWSKMIHLDPANRFSPPTYQTAVVLPAP